MRSIVATLLCLLGAGLLAVACSNNGEGERCELNSSNSGNDDCQDGLVCTQVPGARSALCCPADRSKSSSAECRGGANVGDAAQPTPVDAGSTSDAAPTDASTTSDAAATDAANGG
jgi:hypothetical protein